MEHLVRHLPPHNPRRYRLDAPRGRRAPSRARFSRDLDSSDPFPGPSSLDPPIVANPPLPLLRFFPQHSVEFGEGLLNKGKAKKREKRPLTQIEIMAQVEREKQEKKAARRAAKVRDPGFPTLPGFSPVSASASTRVFFPLVPPRHPF